MPEERWASPEDFATLFQYFWHRDFPMDQKSPGARRSDWTIHTGIVVRNVADLMGFHSRFESGKRKDAVLRSTEQDVVAIEWEWEESWGKEIKKLKEHKQRKLWSYDKNEERVLKYAVLITYTYTSKIGEAYEQVMASWKGASHPLLLILIDVEESTRFFSRREFKHIQMSLFHRGKRIELRSSQALPWKVPKTRWSRELK